MLTRRTLFALSGACAPLALGGLARPVLAQSAGGVDPQHAAAFIQGAGNQLVNVINTAPNAATRRTRLDAVLDANVDVPGVARFCLGRFWNSATPQQQREYVELFRQVLLNSVSTSLGEYRGVRFGVGRPEVRPEGVLVPTTIDRPNATPANVVWVVAGSDAAPHIIDVIAEGTSLRLTRRSDTASYLTRNGNNIGALLEAMRRQG